jgi:hypothetical protein
MVATGNEPLPQQWMRRRLAWAARRAGLLKVPAPIDMRRTFAQWARMDGWTYAEVAKWLGNSSGIVAQVYAPVQNEEISRAVARSAKSSAQLIAITRAAQGARKSPHRTRQAYGQSNSKGSAHGSKLNKRKDLSHGKQTVEGGGTTD